MLLYLLVLTLTFQENEPVDSIFIQLLRSGKYEEAKAHTSNLQANDYLKSKHLGDIFYRQSMYDSAVFHYQKALDLLQKNNDHFELYHINRNIGLTYEKMGDFDQALDHLYHALRTTETHDMGQATLAQIQLNIGSVLDAIGESDKALTFYLASLALKETLKDSSGMARLYNNIGIICKNNLKYDSALHVYNKAISLATFPRDSILSWQLATNLANVYKRMRLADSATLYYKTAISKATVLKNPTYLSDSYYNLAVHYFEMNDYAKCEENFMKALTISSSLENDYELYFLHGSLSELYDAWEKPSEGLDHLQKSNNYRDKLFQEEKEKAIAETMTKYETEKKEQQIALQQAEIAEQKAQNQRNIIFIAGLIAIIVLLSVIALLAKSKLQKKQIMLQQAAEIKLRETQIETTISSQEKERSRFAKDLHDGFGQMISILNLNLKSLEDRDKDRHTIFDRSTKVLEEMYQELKSICFNLMPQTLIQHGLAPAIREFAGRINATDKIFVTTDVFGLDERLTEVQEISLYRITQEWINNILKYSDADKITIQVTRDESELTLLIEDNGTGFSLDLLKAGKGHGWRNINTRVSLIHGELELDTTSGVRGNTLIVNAPVLVAKVKTKENTVLRV